eukprot:TRINITY_DN1006_c0_g4_i1.p2 TRINITY_DN1006_c0_g4~~TRINITY_DN1006_c0_g4_i1.p2  ORF type:complete len:50 (-),score=5.35 TRINITY_DN1006_c0_g4_i1:182-331(-)
MCDFVPIKISDTPKIRFQIAHLFLSANTISCGFNEYNLSLKFNRGWISA